MTSGFTCNTKTLKEYLLFDLTAEEVNKDI